MSPPMTARMAAHIRKRGPLALIAEIEHPNGMGRFWSGVGKLNWNGFQWTGSGILGNVAPVKQTSDLIVQDIQFQLAGVDRRIAAQLKDDVRNRVGMLWLAGIMPGNSVVRDPYPIVDSELDYQTLSGGEDGSSVSIAITAHSGFYNLDRALDECWTTEDQHLLYPDCSGFDMIPGLQNLDLQWTPT